MPRRTARMWWLAAALSLLAATFLLLRASGWHTWSGYGRPDDATREYPLSPIVVERTWRGITFLTHVPECLEIGGSPPFIVRLRKLDAPLELSKATGLPTSVPIFTVLADGSKLPGAWCVNDSGVRQVPGVQLPSRIVFNGDQFVVREWTSVELIDGWVAARSKHRMNDDPIEVAWIP